MPSIFVGSKFLKREAQCIVATITATGSSFFFKDLKTGTNKVLRGSPL
jgi:hypothetical protein